MRGRRKLTFKYDLQQLLKDIVKVDCTVLRVAKVGTQDKGPYTVKVELSSLEEKIQVLAN